MDTKMKVNPIYLHKALLANKEIGFALLVNKKGLRQLTPDECEADLGEVVLNEARLSVISTQAQALIRTISPFKDTYQFVDLKEGILREIGQDAGHRIFSVWRTQGAWVKPFLISSFWRSEFIWINSKPVDHLIAYKLVPVKED